MFGVGTLTRCHRHRPVSPRYKWTALSNTTLGMFMASLDASIVLISLPAIFRGIHLDPLTPGNIGYLLWMLMGYLVVTAVLVVTFGRLGDMFGRVRMYNAGFAVFTAASIALSLTPGHGGSAAMWLIVWRIVQGIGGALLIANSTAILTDAFTTDERGRAMGISMVAAIAGSFIGLIAGGLLADVDWRLVFWVNVPFGLFGTIWAYAKLRELGRQKRTPIDWWGNVTFAAGLILILLGITYGLQPAGGHTMGWTSPVVLAELIGGVALLALFVLIELRVADPMFHLDLFHIRAFTAGNAASLLSSIGRGGLQFMLIIWLQGIWLPLHGYSFERTPLWAGDLHAAADRRVPRRRPRRRVAVRPLRCPTVLGGRDAAGGRLVRVPHAAARQLRLPRVRPAPADERRRHGPVRRPQHHGHHEQRACRAAGAASGMRATFRNTGMVLSIGLFFSLMIVGLSSTLPTNMRAGLESDGVPPASAARIADEPPVGSLFAAFLGYNPMDKLVGQDTLDQLPPAKAADITGQTFFPELISAPFIDGLRIAFSASVVMCLVAAWASWLRGGRYVAGEEEEEVGAFGEPVDRRPDPAASPQPEEWVPA
jgi:MFS family permease